jgi:signal peptidase I
MRLEGAFAFENPWQIVGLVAVACVLRLIASKVRWANRRHRASTVEFIDSVLVAVLLVFCVLRPFVIQAFFIPSSSMEPTLQINDRILVNKFIYFFREPKPGDIVVFDAPPQASEDKKDFIKRVVAMPGDTIRVTSRVGMYRNDQPLTEPYIAGVQDYSWPLDNVLVVRPGDPPTKIDPLKGVSPPPGYLLVMGDNRNNSNDCHHWETRGNDGLHYAAPFLPRENVLGKAMVIFWPPQRVRILH